MYINKPLVTKIEAADKVNLLHSTSCNFEQHKSPNLGKMLKCLYPCLDMCHFMIVSKKTLALHRN